MTPAIELLKKHGVVFHIHHYQHEEAAPSFGLEAVEKLNLSPDKVFKTLIISDESNHLAVAILPVLEKLSMKRIARALSVKKAMMADPVVVQRATGYVLGGVSPLGQKKRLPVIIDERAKVLSTMFISAGRRGLEIELSPQDLQVLLMAKFFDVCV